MSRLLTAFALLLAPLTLYADSFTLNLADTELRSVVSMVSKMTGKNFIVDPRVKGRVTVISPREMSRDEIYQVFLSVLSVHGFAAIPDESVIKIVPEANAKQSAIPTVSGPNQANRDQFVTRVVPIENVSAAQMVPILRPLLPQPGHLSAYPATNVLIISDVAANIERVVDIIKNIDVAVDTEFEIITLKHASATEIANILNSIQPKGTNNGQEERVTVIADARSNSIIFSGVESARNTLKNLVIRLDTPTEQGSGNTKVIYLRYANATKIAGVLSNVAKSLAKIKVDPNQKNQAIDVNIQADETTNSLVISADMETMQELESIIRQLDIRRAQVMVKAVIAEISTDKSAEFGVNWGYYGYPDGRPVGLLDWDGALSGVVSAVQGGSLPPVSSGLNLLFGDGSVGSSGGSGYAGLLRAIRGDADSNILSTPTLVTLDNEEAEIVVGQNVPFVTGSYSSTGDNTSVSNPFQTIKREDVGLTLKIKPQINEGNSIRLEIKQEVSSLSAASVSTSDVVTNKRSLNTTVMVDDGQILALGGLLDETLTESRQKLPGLGDIPLLGYLFSYSRSSKTKRDLTIFLHPRIIRGGQEGMAISSQKYSALRAEQLLQRDRKMSLLEVDVPTVEPLPEFLKLPPPYEERGSTTEPLPIAPGKSDPESLTLFDTLLGQP